MNRTVLGAGLLAIVPLTLVLYLNLGNDPSLVRSPLVHRAAPLFQLRPAGGGSPIALAALRGAPAVINFWSSWCQPCAEEHGALTAAARAWEGRVHFVGIVYEDSEEAILTALRDAGGAAYPSLLDENDRTAVAYGIAGVPETFFVDRRGVIVSKHVGPLDAAALDADLKRLVAAP